MILQISTLVFNNLKDELEDLGVCELDEDGELLDERRAKKVLRHSFKKYTSEKHTIDLTAMSRNECEKLLDILNNCSGVHGTRILAKDIEKYLKASDQGVEAVRARNCRQAAWMLEHYFSELEHHMIFSVDEYGGNSHSAYYVGDIDYFPEVKGSRHEPKRPEYCIIHIWWIENDSRHKGEVRFDRADCLEKTCIEILDGLGYRPENPKLMAKLREETERYYHNLAKIGTKYSAVGIGLADLNDELRGSENNKWGNRLALDKFGKTEVVIDILVEGDKEDKGSSGKGASIDPYRWHRWNMRFHSPSEDEVVAHLEADDDTAEPVDFEVPVHPLVPCFDLRRHTRMRIHINNLTEYVYNKKVADYLVLPERDWKMVNLLVDHSENNFQDIVANKGQSMNVLSVGPPGTGKTATAEVFSEFKERPLYTIQCSQLGLNAEEVEKNLTIILKRANRWDAVLLLDEADVYISKRGSNLQQNAIVGAFLRVLEYASCILFMTSNLEDSIDDAIASRCIASLHYGMPSPGDQARIWKILAKLNDLEISDEDINKVVNKFALSGRDVKNLMKLASFATKEKKLTFESIEYAMQFKPTKSI